MYMYMQIYQSLPEPHYHSIYPEHHSTILNILAIIKSTRVTMLEVESIDLTMNTMRQCIFNIRKECSHAAQLRDNGVCFNQI